MKGVLGRAYNFRGKPKNKMLASIQSANLGVSSRLKKEALKRYENQGVARELEGINERRRQLGLRELTPEMHRAQRMENAAFELRAFEHDVARRLNVQEERKALAEARERVHRILQSELNPALARLLSEELTKGLGPGVIMQLQQSGQLKEFLSQSGELKKIVSTLKKGGRIQKNQMTDAVEELKEMFRAAQEQ